MSALASLAIAAALAASPQPARGADDADAAPVRCRPAPYYVATVQPRPKAQRLVITGAREPAARYEKPARSCHLMSAPTGRDSRWRAVRL